MLSKMELLIMGKPEAWQRSGYNHYTGAKYTQYKTRKQEEYIATMWKAENKEKYDKDIPLSMYIRIGKVRPKSSKREFPTVKPDVDNYAKLVQDALNGIAYHDDAQICSLLVQKVYCEQEYTFVRIEALI